MGVGARSTNSIGCYGLSLLACTHTTYSLVFVLCSLITCALLQAQAVACLALSTLSLPACALLQAVACCCLLCCRAHHFHTFHCACSLHLCSLLDCDCCLPCLRSLALPVRRLCEACTSARAFRSCPCTSTSAGQARLDKTQNQFVFNIRRARNALLPLSRSAAQPSSSSRATSQSTHRVSVAVVISLR